MKSPVHQVLEISSTIEKEATFGPWFYDMGNHQIETREYRMIIANEEALFSRTEDFKHMYGEDKTQWPCQITDPYHDFILITHARNTMKAKDEMIRAMYEALNSIASWGDGDVVGSHFDNPGDAKAARNAIYACDEIAKGILEREAR